MPRRRQSLQPWLDDKSFGPIVSGIDGDDALTAACIKAHLRCLFLHNGICTHVKPNRDVPNPSETPDWCAMKETRLQETRDHLAGKPVK